MMGQDDASVPTTHPHRSRPYSVGILHPIVGKTESVFVAKSAFGSNALSLQKTYVSRW